MAFQASPRKYLLASFIIKCYFKSKLKQAPVCSLWDSTFICCCCEKQQITVYPINFIFRSLQNRSLMQVWLCGYMNMQREGCTIGLDRNVKLIVDDTEDVHSKSQGNNWVRSCSGEITFCSQGVSRDAQWSEKPLRSHCSVLGWEVSSKILMLFQLPLCY